MKIRNLVALSQATLPVLLVHRCTCLDSGPAHAPGDSLNSFVSVSLYPRSLFSFLPSASIYTRSLSHSSLIHILTRPHVQAFVSAHSPGSFTDCRQGRANRRLRTRRHPRRRCLRRVRLSFTAFLILKLVFVAHSLDSSKALLIALTKQSDTRQPSLTTSLFISQ